MFGKRKSLTCAQKWVSGLGLLILVIGLANLGRAGVALHYAVSLPGLPLTASLGYLAAMGVFWGAVLTVAALGLLRFRPWGRWATLGAVTCYQAHVWVNHLLLDASDYARRTWPWDLLLTWLLLALVWGSLNLPGVRTTLSTPGQVPHASEGAGDSPAQPQQASHAVGGPVTATPDGKKEV